MKYQATDQDNQGVHQLHSCARPAEEDLLDSLRLTRSALGNAMELAQGCAPVLGGAGPYPGEATVADGTSQVRPHLSPQRMQAESTRHERRIAGIADEFTAACLGAASQFTMLSCEAWRAELDREAPDFLFVESAWNGNCGEWKNRVHKLSPELLALLDYCKKSQIPTIFWNKEDPVHYNAFISTASKFDYVFTTDIGTISRYKTQLKHNRVYLMPFFAEPKLHNPIATMPRKYDVTFAGAYYHNYSDRARDFDEIIAAISAHSRVRIFDRNWNTGSTVYAFPEKYADVVGPGVPYADIEQAYKSGTFGLNMNSVKSSQTMFARRVFDLICSYTHVLSNNSPALKLIFGDLVTASDEGSFISARMKQLQGPVGDFPAGILSKYVRSKALRKVLAQHTTDNRLDYIYHQVLGMASKPNDSVCMVARVETLGEVESVVAAFNRQCYDNISLILTGSHDFLVELSLGKALPPNVFVQLDDECAADTLQEYKWVALISPKNFYGAHYVTDLQQASLYSNAQIVTKRAHVVDSIRAEQARLGMAGFEYVSHSLRSSSLARTDLVPERIPWTALTASGASWNTDQGPIISTDEFEFGLNCAEDPWAALHGWACRDGISIDSLRARAEELEAVESRAISEVTPEETIRLDTAFEAGDFVGGKVTVQFDSQTLHMSSTMEAEQHTYVYAMHRIDHLDEVLRGRKLPITIVASPGLNVSGVVLFIDKAGERCGFKVFPVNHGMNIEVPEQAHQLHLGLRLQGAGDSQVSGIYLKNFSPAVAVRSWMTSSKVLTLTNVYPSYDNFYRNGFIHRRLKSYQQQGLESDVYCLGRTENADAYNYNGIDVIKGGKQRLRNVMLHNSYEAVLVHFLDKEMWEVLQEFVPRMKIIVWVHGAEIQPWHRRSFNYRTAGERSAAIEVSDTRMAFWQSFLGRLHPNVHLVFVSKYFAREVMEDTGIEIDSRQYSIIHNVIDVDLFRYSPKQAEQRFKVLSIRPYASRKYANDLSVEAVRILSEEPGFSRFRFRFVGDGPLFDDVLAPIRDLPNVEILRKFLSQEEIASMHRDYGVFLCPTRMDSQGVSKDEAMSSGLVPVTTDITAIPEFVDSECGWLAPPESAAGLADGLRAISTDEQLFARLSRGAAERVRRQTGPAQTIDREIQFIYRFIGSIETAGAKYD